MPRIPRGSIVKSKSSPERSPCSLIVFSKDTVPFTDHTPVVMFFIAASNSADGVSWFDAVDFFCVFAKPTDALAKRKTTGSSEIHVVEKEGPFLIKTTPTRRPWCPQSGASTLQS